MNAEPQRLAADDRSPEGTFGLLANRRRSRLVSALACREPAVSLRALASAVADRESSTPTDSLEREVAISLHHVHLPRLSDADVVDYDPETRTVTDVRTDRLRSLISAGD